MLEMLRQARDFNPDVAEAVDNFVTLCNPGYDLNVYYANKQGDDGKAVPDEEGQRLVREFAIRMFSEYSGAWDEIAGTKSDLPGLRAFIDMTHLTLATQGAMAAEVELTEALNDIVDVYPVDPSIVDFQMVDKSNRFVPGLRLMGHFTPLDPVRFRYIPKDPDVFQPGGRPPLMSVLDTVFFQQQFMRELQSVVHMVNSPRLDIKLLEETAVTSLKQTRPDLFNTGREDDLQVYLDAMLADIKTVAQTLEADDAFVHYDSVEAQFIGPQGTAIPVDHIMAAIDKMMISGVRQLPLLLGRNEGATTTHATVQWQVFILKLGGFQRISRSLVVWALNLYLRILGRQSYADFEYKAHKTSDTLLDAQALNINIASYGNAVDRGWKTDDEASMELFGHIAHGTPKTEPVLAPEAPPRFFTTDGIHPSAWPGAKPGGARAIDQAVHGLAGWLQKVHHEALHDYRGWRATAVVPKFGVTLHELTKTGSLLKNMSDTEAITWLYDRLKLTAADDGRLTAVLEHMGKRTATAAIEEQLRAVKRPQRVNLTSPAVLKQIEHQASTNALSIVETYNADLLAAIESELTESGRDDNGIVDKLRTAIGNLIHWEGLRNFWKEAQVALSETQATVMNAIHEFFDRNDVQGEAEVYPYSSTADICADYIAANPYPSMRDALNKTDLPAHVRCPHYVRLVGEGEVEGDLWVGED
jgi:hypothetical protein